MHDIQQNKQLGGVLAALCICCAASQAWAEATLLGREVSLQVVTFDDPNAPIFESDVKWAATSNEIEFGLQRTKSPEDIDVIPVLIDVQSTHITFNYNTAVPGELYPAKFNGYIIDFHAGCDLVTGASLDTSDTTLPIGDDALFWDKDRLYVNVQGQSFNRKSRIAIDLEINDCQPESGGKKSKS